MGLIGIYFLEGGKPEVAERYYDILKEIAPDYPMTKMLQRKLHPGVLGQMLSRMSDQGRSKSS